MFSAHRCFIHDKVCPSNVPEPTRVACAAGGGARPDCLAAGCVWCETATPGRLSHYLFIVNNTQLIYNVGYVPSNLSECLVSKRCDQTIQLD